MAVALRADGTIRRYGSWQRTLTDALAGVPFDRMTREVFKGRRFAREALGDRVEDFASQYPERAFLTLAEVVLDCAALGDRDGVRHFLGQVDEYLAWQAEPRGLDAPDPWEAV